MSAHDRSHTRRRVAVVGVLLAVNCAAAGADCPDADLLVYDDGYFSVAYVVAAFQLDVSFRYVYDYADFNAMLTTHAYRLVVVSGQSFWNGEGWGPLTEFISNGGRVVFTYHRLQDEPDLAAAFGVTAAGDFPSGVVDSVEQLIPHEIWTGVNSPLVLQDTGALDNGDKLSPAVGSQAIAQFITGGGTPDGGAIVIGNDGRTVINGFIADNAVDEEQMIQLAKNEILFVLPPVPDCNGNGIHDACDIAWGISEDCNENGTPDDCEPGYTTDCNENGEPDFCDVYTGVSQDCNENAVPDECDIATGTSQDCNANGVPDECDTSGGGSPDCDHNSVPDECQPPVDCNSNGSPDFCDIYTGVSEDCNENAVPDECEPGYTTDCNANGEPDFCDLYSGGTDCNENDVLDECESPPETFITGQVTWRRIRDGSDPGDPSHRWAAAMAYDAARAVMILFAGRSVFGFSGQQFNDTWQRDGAAWTQLFPPASPSVRSEHAMVYNSATQKVVLFGGACDQITDYGDTWTWNGSQWTQVTGSGPSARRGHAMAFDSTRNVVVLFGGIYRTYPGTDNYLGDTWERSGGYVDAALPLEFPERAWLPHHGL
jgi:hypothetical protein